MLYAPPPEIATTVFTRMPDALRMRGRTSVWSVGKDSHDLHSFLEGPEFDAAGNLYVTDIPWGRIFRIAPDGSWSLVVEYDGWPNGLKFHRDGRLFVADHKNGIVTVDVATGAVTPVLSSYRREGFKGINDLTFDASGNLFFTDQGQTDILDPTGRVYRLSPDGRLDCLVRNAASPNGLVLSKDDKALFLAVTRTNQIWRVPLQADGTTAKVGAFINLSGGSSGPDGLALGEDGSLVVAHCGLGTVWVFSELGEPTFRIRSCDTVMTTNIAFSGKSLFITDSGSGSILRAELPFGGRKVFA